MERIEEEPQAIDIKKLFDYIRNKVSTYWGSPKILDPPTDPFWLMRLTDNKKASWETR